MVKIDKIELQNFRFFTDKKILEFEGKNILIYGENGSGKSSLFKALEFLTKTDIDEIEFVNNQNIFDRESDMFLEFEFSNNETLRIDIDHLSLDNQYPFIEKLSISKPILDYKSLLQIHYKTDTNDKDINLYLLFEKLLKSYPINNNTLLGDLRGINYFNNLENIIKNELLENINIFLMGFEHKFQIEEIYFDAFEREIILKIEYFEEKIEKYHLFLNEARLSALAISIYFSIIKKQFDNFDNNSLKILALDDLLISLDMSNRVNLIDILKSEFRDFQIFLFTHDRAFFEIAKQQFNYMQRGEWKYFEMFVDIDDERGIEIPYIKTDGQTYENLTRAKEHFRNKDYPASANYLRKEVERLFDEYLQINNLEEKIKLSKLKENEQLIWDIQKDLKKLLRVLEQFGNCDRMPEAIQAQKCREFSEQVITSIESTQKYINDEFHFEEFEDVKMVLKNILHPQSHNDLTRPLYKRELENAIELVEAFNRILGETT